MIENKDIGTIVNKGVSSASLIIDDNGIIISFNDRLSSMILELEPGKPFSNHLSLEESQLFERIILKAKNSKSSIKDTISIKQGDENSEFEIFVTPFLGEDDNLFFVSFTKAKRLEIRSGENKISLLTKDLSGMVDDEIILELIGQIKAEFPFTIIGKTKIKRLINQYDKSFWIKSPEGKFIVVNDIFANNIGLKSFRIEGKKGEEFFPRHLSDFLNEIDSYVVSTLNSIVFEGAMSAMFGKEGKSSVFETPIYDIDEKVVALVGFVVNKKETQSESQLKHTYSDVVIDDFDDAVIVFDRNLNCRKLNNSAKELLGFTNDTTVENKNIEEIFSHEFYSNVSYFLNENSSAQELNIDLPINNNYYNVLVKKIKNEREEFNGAYFLFKEFEEKQIENERSVNMHDLIMQNSPEAMFIYVVDNLKFIEANDAALRLYEYSKTEFLMMDLTDLYAPEDIQTLIESANSTRTEMKFTGPWRHRSKSGKTILIELSKSEIDYNGQRCHLNIVREVTEKVELDKKIQLFKASFDNSDDLIINTDRDGFINYVNNAVTKILGHSKKDLMERPLLSLLSNKDRALINTEIFHSGISETQRLHIDLKSLSGELIPASITSTPIKDFNDEIDSFNLIIKPDPVKEIVQKEVIKTASGLDSSFLSNLFHEILTPINVIIGFSQEINESLTNPSDEQIEAAEIIQENKKMLLQIMDNAVEYASIEQSQITLKPERLVFVDLLDQLQEDIKKPANAKGIELAYGKISSSLSFDSDKQRFISALSLLLNFAIKVLNDEKIYLSAYQIDSESFVISVKDGRSGISDKLFENLNDLYQKDEDLLRRQFDTSRFMIRLARKLVDILNAKIYPVEKNGEVTEFGILFPNILVVEKKPEPVAKPVEAEVTVAQPLSEEIIQEQVVQAEPLVKKEVEVHPEAVRAVQSSTAVHNETITENEPQIEDKVTETVESPVVVHTPTPVEPIVEKSPEPKIEEPIVAQAVDSGKIVTDGPLTDLSCLYVEDQVDSQILFKVQMKDFKSIDFANSFEKALPLIKSKKYDFIVMDINLQGEYNGLDALRIIQKLAGYQEVPIIAVTAYVLPGDREKFIAAGFNDFISKPVLRDKLIDCLTHIFKSR